MPFEFKKENTSIKNENTIENTSSNTTTKQMNTEEEKKLLTFSLRKENVEEKTKKKENKGFVHNLLNIFSNKLQEFIKMREAGDIDMLDTGIVIVLSSLWLEVGAVFAGMAGSPIVAEDLVVGGVFGMCVGFTIAAIGTLRG